MFQRRRLLHEAAAQGLDKIGLMRRKAVLRRGFDMEHYEYGRCFDNIVLVAARGPLRLRLVRDRGDSFCEARSTLHPGAEHWVDYNPYAPFPKMKGMDFDVLLAEIFGESNESRLSALVALAEDASRFSHLNHYYDLHS